MQRYFGRIHASQGFGRPISLQVDIKGYKKFSELARRIHTEKIGPYLQEKKWTLHSSIVEGFAVDSYTPIAYTTVAKDVGLEDKLDPEMPVKKVEINGEEKYVPYHALKAHEENHKEVMSLGLWDTSRFSGQARAYFDMLTESLADVLGDLADLAHYHDKEAMKDHMMRRGEFGWTLLGIVSEAQHGKGYPDLAERIREGYKIIPSFRENPNWADILHDVMYNGLYGVCFDLIRTHSEEKGKEIVYEAIHKLQDAPDALDYLQKNLPKLRPIPIIKEINITQNKLYCEHIVPADNARFELKIWCPDEPIPVSDAKALVVRTKKITDHVLSQRQGS